MNAWFVLYTHIAQVITHATNVYTASAYFAIMFQAFWHSPGGD